MPVFKIYHVTKYNYTRPVKESLNEIKIYPYQNHEQEVLNHELNISFFPEALLYIDYWGNRVGSFSIQAPHTELVIESKVTVRTLAPTQLKINFHSGFQQLETEINDELYLLELSAIETIKSQPFINEVAASILMVKDCYI